MHRPTGITAKLIALLMVAALLVPMAVLPARAQDSAEPKVLRIHQPVYPDDFDPQKSSFTNEIDILTLAYEGLTKLNEKQETVPAAAENWEFNEDATSITFTLREGLLWSDGEPMTASR